MAIIACTECAHQVSDRAVSCPGCGAPVAAPTKSQSPRRILPRVLIALAVLWMIGTTLWIAAIRSPGELFHTPKPSAQHTAQPQPQPPAASQPPPALMPLPVPPPAEQPPAEEPKAAPTRAVYLTTAEQLYQDYNANEVATQSKIGESRVRVTGRITAIEQDPDGHPLVKLSTSSDNSAGMTLGDDQQAAAAQLVKGQTVDIQCDRMRRMASSMQGTDCTLVSVNAGSRQVNLAVFLSNGMGTARVYVIGPMSESACMSRSDGISARLSTALHGDHVSSKNCTDTVRESIPPEGCHLTSPSAMSVPDIPSAHLWRYDCALPTAPARPAPALEARRTAVASAPVASRHGTASSSNSSRFDIAITPGPAEEDTTTDEEPAVARAAPSDEAQAAPARPSMAVPSEASGPVRAAPSDSSSLPKVATAAAVTAGVAATAAPAGSAATAAPADAPTLAMAQRAPDAGTHPSAASTGASSASSPDAPSDDLSTVRAKDPQAADHIASYCANTIASANRPAFIAECRRREVDAWTRLVLNNEFPTLDDATRQKCSEPPFPDTYTAKESCAKYALHIN